MRRLLVLLLLSHAALAQPVPDPVREGPPTAPEALTPPRLLEPVIAEYPPGATGAARVVLQVDVDETGLPQNVKVLSQPQPGFDERLVRETLVHDRQGGFQGLAQRHLPAQAALLALRPGRHEDPV